MKFTLNKVIVMVLVGVFSYDTAGRLTRWLYEKDVFLVMCFVVTLWGISFLPVWIVDKIIRKMTDREQKYTNFKYTKTKM